jgi:hypothetical protein
LDVAKINFFSPDNRAEFFYIARYSGEIFLALIGFYKYALKVVKNLKRFCNNKISSPSLIDKRQKLFQSRKKEQKTFLSISAVFPYHHAQFNPFLVFLFHIFLSFYNGGFFYEKRAQ